jgi:hypothetical protein
VPREVVPPRENALTTSAIGIAFVTVDTATNEVVISGLFQNLDSRLLPLPQGAAVFAGEFGRQGRAY